MTSILHVARASSSSRAVRRDSNLQGVPRPVPRGASSDGSLRVTKGYRGDKTFNPKGISPGIQWDAADQRCAVSWSNPVTPHELRLNGEP